jgi:hypothetical protein
MDLATPAATVFLSGEAVRVPMGWSVAYGHGRHGASLYLRAPGGGALHVLTVTEDGDVRAVLGLPEDLLSDLERAYLPRRAR